MKAFLRSTTCKLLKTFPLDFFYRVVSRLINLRLENEKPADALSFTLQLDNFLYGLSGQWAVAYDNGVHAKHRLTNYVEHFAELASQHKGPYLDIGCGNGELARAIAKKVSQDVVGIDILSSKIEKALDGEKLDNLTFIQGDATQFEFEERFKTLILSNVFEHIEERVPFLKAVIRHHQPDCLLIRVPNFERDWRVPLKKELGIEWRLDVTHFTEHSLPEFINEIESSGLNITHCEIRWGEIWAITQPIQKSPS